MRISVSDDSKVEEHNARPFLIAHLAIARALSHVANWEDNATIAVMWLSKSVEKYTWVLDNASRHLPKDNPKIVEAELRYAKECTALLSLKINRLQRGSQ
eukprot:INCI744.5.p1 GENE.INCI744.5~~INCI744.5.p1  ORF type:complete len:100 (-),score=18.83 INCI744.5:166-465(-)